MKIYIKKVRLMESTYSENEITKAMIGKELEVRNIYLSADTISVFTEDKSDWWNFNLSDVRFLTPHKFQDNYIAIGDEIYAYGKWRTVEYFDSKGLLDTSNNYFKIDNITDHRTGLKETEEMTLKQVCKELGRDIKIIKE